MWIFDRIRKIEITVEKSVEDLKLIEFNLRSLEFVNSNEKPREKQYLNRLLS